jgi:hypothetical protein
MNSALRLRVSERHLFIDAPELRGSRKASTRLDADGFVARLGVDFKLHKKNRKFNSPLPLTQSRTTMQHCWQCTRHTCSAPDGACTLLGVAVAV